MWAGRCGLADVGWAWQCCRWPVLGFATIAFAIAGPSALGDTVQTWPVKVVI